MKTFFAAIKRAPKLYASIAMITAAVVVPAALFAWGPDRPNVDAKTGADHVVFNSMTNNPNYGNERQFITVKDPKTGEYGNNVNVEPGQEYMVRVMAHNDANPEAHPDKDLTAKNTTLKTVVSPKTGKTSAITAYLSADNATPQKIHADVGFTSDKEFNLAYVGGSAKAYNNGYAAGGDGKAFSDSLVTSAGAKLGYEAEGDGKIPGCFQYINFVYFKVKPQFAAKPDFTMDKTVSEAGKNSWNDNMAVKPGQTVDYRIEYKNTGEVQQDDVIIRDTLPKGVTYVKGSSVLYNSSNKDGKKLSDNIVTKGGVNIGSHAPTANAFVVFTAKVAGNDDLEKCGANTLINKASVETDYGTKDDKANVTTDKECATPVYTCDNLAANKIDRTNYSFTGKASAKDGASITSYTFDFGDGKSTTVTNPSDVKHTYAKAGTYTVKLSVKVAVNGKAKTVTSDACATKITVEQPPVTKIEVCDLDSKKIITIDEKDFNSKKHSTNLDDCKEVVKEIKVCELDTKKVITINEKDFDSAKHSKDLTDCDEVTVPTIEVCDLDTKKVVTIDEKDFDNDKHSKDLADCDAATPPETSATPEAPVTPETPDELPQTGAASDLLTLLSAGSLIAALGYYVASRRLL